VEGARAPGREIPGSVPGTGEGAIVTQPQRHPPAGAPEPVLITDAARSYEDELRSRKRRYGLMMGMRVPCMVLAALFYQTPWLAVTLLVLSIPLPWMAVLIANDRLPRKREEVNRYRPDRNALEARPHPVIDAAPAAGAADRPVVDGDGVDGRWADRDRVVDGEVVGEPSVGPVRGAHRGT
jgi:hypothetical protein